MKYLDKVLHSFFILCLVSSFDTQHPLPAISIFSFLPLQLSYKLIAGFQPPHKIGVSRISRTTILSALSPALSNGEEDNSGSSFDFDFANSMSKPLPEWFQKEREEKAKYLKELEENRERILREFKAKYEISEAQKLKDREERWQKLQAKVDAKEDFVLPNFFDVHPELKLKWPQWSKNKNGRKTKCTTDKDCPFPEACCPHPLLPGDKFCCTGFGKRMLEPAYQPQEIAADLDPRGGKDAQKQEEAERRRRGKKAWQPLDE